MPKVDVNVESCGYLDYGLLSDRIASCQLGRLDGRTSTFH